MKFYTFVNGFLSLDRIKNFSNNSPENTALNPFILFLYFASEIQCHNFNVSFNGYKQEQG